MLTRTLMISHRHDLAFCKYSNIFNIVRRQHSMAIRKIEKPEVQPKNAQNLPRTHKQLVDTAKQPRSIKKLEDLFAAWIRFMEWEQEVQEKSQSLREQHITGVGNGLVKLPVRGGSIKKGTMPGTVLLELSMEEEKKKRINLFRREYPWSSDYYKRGAHVQLTPVCKQQQQKCANAESAEDTKIKTYKGIIQSNDNNVLKILLFGSYDFKKLNQIKQFTISIPKFDHLERFKKLVKNEKKEKEEGGKYKACAGYPLMLKCFGLRKLRDVSLKEDKEKCKGMRFSTDISPAERAALLSLLNDQNQLGSDSSAKAIAAIKKLIALEDDKKSKAISAIKAQKPLKDAQKAAIKRALNAHNAVGLNPSQKAAIWSALNAQRDFVVIHGPPGTGKTRVIAEIVYQQSLRKNNRGEPYRVLICAPSNKAVDNALIACIDCLDAKVQEKCLRLGFGSNPANEQLSSTHLHAMIKQHCFFENLKRLRDREDAIKSGDDEKMKETMLGKIIKRSQNLEQHIQKSIIKNMQIIFCTTACKLLYEFLDGEDKLFRPDLIILDEAAQVLEPHCWQILLNAPRFILVGDHKQFRPIIYSKNARTEEEFADGLPIINTKPKPKPKKVQKKEERKIRERAVMKKRMPISLLERLDPNPPKNDENKKKKSGEEKKDKREEKELEEFPYLSLLNAKVLEGKEGYLHMLNENYRSNELINHWSNKHSYDKKLSTHPSAKNITLANIVQASRINGQFFILDPLVLVDTALFTKEDLLECQQLYNYRLLGMHDFRDSNKRNAYSFTNTGEALCAAIHLLALKQIAGLGPEDFGCITSYTEQTKLIKDFLGPNHSEIEISSVDAFQGQQRQAIVMSFVRSNKQNDIGFMSEMERMNVALTRAKRQFLLIASSRSLITNKKLKDLCRLIYRKGRVVHPKELLLQSPHTLAIPKKFPNIFMKNAKPPVVVVNNSNSKLDPLTLEEKYSILQQKRILDEMNSPSLNPF